MTCRDRGHRDARGPKGHAASYVLLPMVCMPWPMDLMAFENASDSIPNNCECAWNLAMTVWNCWAPEALLLPDRVLSLLLSLTRFCAMVPSALPIARAMASSQLSPLLP